MGRRARKKQTTVDGTSSSARADMMHLVFGLMDLAEEGEKSSGEEDGSQSSRRIQLLRSLAAVTATLRSSESPSPTVSADFTMPNNTDSMDAVQVFFSDGTPSMLLELEEGLHTLLQAAHNFLSSNATCRAEAWSLTRQIQDLLQSDKDVGGGDSMVQWSLVASQLAASLVRHMQVEQRAVEMLVQSVQGFYDNHHRYTDDNAGSEGRILSPLWRGQKVVMLQTAARGLSSRKRFAQSPLYRQLLDIVHRELLQQAGESEAQATTPIRPLVDDGPISTAQYSQQSTSPPSFSALEQPPHTAGASNVQEPHCCWTAYASLDRLVQAFLFDITPITNGERPFPNVITAMVVGPEGSGKTFTCDRIERQARDAANVSVIRPRLPMDFMGRSVGDMEDSIISVFGAVRYALVAATTTEPHRLLVLLDDVHSFLFEDVGGQVPPSTRAGGRASRGSHLHIVRARNSFMSELYTLRSIRVGGQSDARTMIICTSRTSAHASMGPAAALAIFDKTFELHDPTPIERRSLIMDHFGLDLLHDASPDSLTREASSLLDGLVESTVGKSFAELSQYCRQALEDAVEKRDSSQPEGADWAFQVLHGLKERQSDKTGSLFLRSGVLVDDFVDMNVLTGKDLLGDSTLQPSGLCLFGSSIERGFAELQQSIIIPLCHAKALAELLSGEDASFTDTKVVTGGLLLTGAPGTGKSALALEAARYAARLVPSIKLVDVSCTSLIHKEVGGSERAVHNLFVAARKAAPCILLMDGIENIAAVRGNDPTTEGTMDRVLSTLLVELDGMTEDEDSGPSGGYDMAGRGIAVIGITHNPEWIDPAVKRPGRLEKVVELHVPDEDARTQIVMRELELFCPESPVGFENQKLAIAKVVAPATKGMSGASVVGICNDIKMLVMREKKAQTPDGTIDIDAIRSIAVSKK